MRGVQRGAAAVGLWALGVLALLDVWAGLDRRGWAVGSACAVFLAVALGEGLRRHSRRGLGPADRVTAARAALTCGVAGLVAGPGTGPAGEALRVLVGTAAAALLLDAVDGAVARRTGTASRFGAGFDMEVDAFLLVVLSVEVSRSTGAWVMLIGAARYGLLVAGAVVPWLRRPTPPRRWVKVVAAVQGVALVVAASRLLPPPLVAVELVAAVLLLAASFGHQVWWLSRQRRTEHASAVAAFGPSS